MGMFDDYFHDVRCPHCGNIQSYWQGKDGPCTLHKFNIGDQMVNEDATPLDHGVMQIYEVCGRDRAAGISESDHWLDALAIVYEGRWVTTIITKVTEYGDAVVLWNIRKE